MNYRGGCWLLLAAPVALIACGDNGSAGGPDSSAGRGGSAEAGIGGFSSSGGSSGSAHGGAGGSSAAAGSSGSGGAHSGGAGDPGGAGGAGEAGGAGGAALATDILVPVVKAFCAAARQCCSAANITADLDDCESTFAKNDPTFAALDKGTATLDQAGLAACLAAYRQAATQCQELAVISACQGLIHGTKKANEPCTDVGECARAAGDTVACAIVGQDATAGVCAKVAHGKSGDSCLGTCETGEDCSFTSFGATDTNFTYCFEQEGFFCSLSDTHCVAITALGAPCASDEECGSANYCDTTCKKRSGLGEPCAQTCLSSLQCIDNQCLSPSFTVGGTCSGQWFGPY